MLITTLYWLKWQLTSHGHTENHKLRSLHKSGRQENCER